MNAKYSLALRNGFWKICRGDLSNEIDSFTRLTHLNVPYNISTYMFNIINLGFWRLKPGTALKGFNYKIWVSLSHWKKVLYFQKNDENRLFAYIFIKLNRPSSAMSCTIRAIYPGVLYTGCNAPIMTGVTSPRYRNPHQANQNKASNLIILGFLSFCLSGFLMFSLSPRGVFSAL